jgi:clan AA aspartic protease
MIAGIVNEHHEATVRIRMRGPTGIEYDLVAVIDTGFDGWLMVPQAVAASLELPQEMGGNAILADGSQRKFFIHLGEIWWIDEWRTQYISVVGSEPLIGMGMLAGHDLHIAIEPGGEVVISPIQKPDK